MHSVGLNVETFGSGAEFLKSIDTQLPDCVVLDLHMPHNGFTVQAHLAKVHAPVPVIMITGHELPNDRDRAMASGASAFLCKPVNDQALLEAISAAVDSANGANGSEP